MYAKIVRFLTFVSLKTLNNQLVACIPETQLHGSGTHTFGLRLEVFVKFMDKT